MALWRKNTAMSAIQQEIRRKERQKKDIIRRGAFYHYWEPLGFRANERYECAGNRRASDEYVQNF